MIGYEGLYIKLAMDDSVYRFVALQTFSVNDQLNTTRGFMPMTTFPGTETNMSFPTYVYAIARGRSDVFETTLRMRFGHCAMCAIVNDELRNISSKRVRFVTFQWFRL